jgi:excinuclease UvrABC ATPase subunit
VSIEQRTSRGGGKSTVATVTEAYHFLRLLFARLGTQYCPDCQLPVEAQTRDQLARGLKAELKRRGDLLLLAPVVRNRKGFHTDVAEWAAKNGYAEIRADEKIYRTDQPFRLDRFREHDVEIVIGVLERKRKQQWQTLVDETLKLGRCSRSITRNSSRFIQPNAPVHVAAAPLRRSIRKFSATTLRRAGVRTAAVLVSCSICLMSIVARAPMRSKNPGSNGRKAAAKFAPIARARA